MNPRSKQIVVPAAISPYYTAAGDNLNDNLQAIGQKLTFAVVAHNYAEFVAAYPLVGGVHTVDSACLLDGPVQLANANDRVVIGAGGSLTGTTPERAILRGNVGPGQGAVLTMQGSVTGSLEFSNLTVQNDDAVNGVCIDASLYTPVVGDFLRFLNCFFRADGGVGLLLITAVDVEFVNCIFQGTASVTTTAAIQANGTLRMTGCYSRMRVVGTNAGTWTFRESQIFGSGGQPACDGCLNLRATDTQFGGNLEPDAGVDNVDLTACQFGSLVLALSAPSTLTLSLLNCRTTALAGTLLDISGQDLVNDGTRIVGNVAGTLFAMDQPGRIQGASIVANQARDVLVTGASFNATDFPNCVARANLLGDNPAAVAPEFPAGGAATWAATLAAGNNTGGNLPTITAADFVVFEAGDPAQVPLGARSIKLVEDADGNEYHQAAGDSGPRTALSVAASIPNTSGYERRYQYAQASTPTVPVQVFDFDLSSVAGFTPGASAVNGSMLTAECLVQVAQAQNGDASYAYARKVALHIEPDTVAGYQLTDPPVVLYDFAAAITISFAVVAGPLLRVTVDATSQNSSWSGAIVNYGVLLDLNLITQP